MIDLKYYNVICKYYDIIINNKSQNISARLVYNLFNKYKILDQRLRDNINNYMYRYHLYFITKIKFI
jgi:hypothetical protein